MAMTYNSLIQDVITYAERDDDPFVAQVPSFIENCENKLAMEDKPLGYQRVVSGQLNGNVLAKPARWRKSKSFSILNGSERSYLFLRTYEYCRSYWPDISLVSTPKYYADYDYEHFFVAPSPDTNYEFELVYYERPSPLSPTVQTNWTTQYAPQLLLYGTLMEAMPFLKTSERIPEFQGLYDRALQALMKEDAGRIIDASA